MADARTIFSGVCGLFCWALAVVWYFLGNVELSAVWSAAAIIIWSRSA